MPHVILHCFVLGLVALQAAAERPNVLFLIADDLGAQALGCYGNEQAATPHIDALAASGVRFTCAYSQYPICGPSRAALMAGLYPETLGIMGNGSSDRFEQAMGDKPSMSEHFRRHGYHAARVGKIYHMRVPGDITACVDGPDHAESWDEKHNCCGPEWMSEGRHAHHSNEKLNRDPDKHYGLGFGSAFYEVRTPEEAPPQPDVIAADKAIEILEARGGERFFLAVGFVRPHVPLVAPERYFGLHPPSELTLPEKRPGDWEDIPKPGISRSSKSMGMDGQPEVQQAVLSAYYASVTFMDDQVGRILATLERLGLRENTIVVFTSDHGYHLGEHDFWQKVSLHEESVRIPLVIDVPGIDPRISDALVEQIDLYPTLAELAGLPVPKHVAGMSLASHLHDSASPNRTAAYAVVRHGALLRTERWAFIEYHDKSRELYDMENDPAQYTNLAGREEVTEAEKALAAALEHKRTAARRGSD